MGSFLLVDNLFLLITDTPIGEGGDQGRGLRCRRGFKVVGIVALPMAFRGIIRDGLDIGLR